MKNVNSRCENIPDFITVISDGKLTANSDPFAEIAFVELGVTPNALNAFVNILGWEIRAFAEAIGTKERKLRLNMEHRLDKQVSENLMEIAKLCAFGTSYFDSIDIWNQWLNTPHIQFNSHKPYSVIHTIRGRELIKSAITKLRYGFTA
ncbi:antitoxin Xre/MbcA/ParS toxin-binding domain-containing protein [Pseudoalteromonas gelatinilytica]|uniref:antitoxin Xre/MbcA/ParS toxin-binding domain-containing protein n=1 Tax=Pseudoalteromonas gelatinilytica TaxID=1703256 RepID=UPI0007C4BE55|nr:antitoxin Xre/MbcA/ParS toxin-binding domain-containing protein [Pseudoalteromonas gelatinilytica]